MTSPRHSTSDLVTCSLPLGNSNDTTAAEGGYSPATRQRSEDSHATQNVQRLRNFRAQMRVLVPATFHQCPQLCRDIWVCRPWRAPALYYVRYGHGSRLIAEWDRAGEYLC